MTSSYNRKLDRLITHNSVTGSYGHGMHDFIIDEIELGARAALTIGDPEQAWWEVVGNKKLVELMNGDSSQGDC